MNFTTDLPKRNPVVSYIVASAVRCEKFFPGGSKNGPVYRMHAVILKKKPNFPPETQNGREFQLYICCHVRKVESGDEEPDKDKVVGQTAASKMKKQQSQQITSGQDLASVNAAMQRS